MLNQQKSNAVNGLLNDIVLDTAGAKGDNAEVASIKNTETKGTCVKSIYTKSTCLIGAVTRLTSIKGACTGSFCTIDAYIKDVCFRSTGISIKSAGTRGTYT